MKQLLKDLKEILPFTAFVASIFVVLAVIRLLLDPGAINLGRQKLVISDMRALGGLYEQYREKYGTFPTVTESDALENALAEFGEPHMVDGWARPYVFYSSGDSYTIVCRCRDGILEVDDPSTYEQGATRGSDADIVYSNGDFFRYPQGMLLSEDRED